MPGKSVVRGVFRAIFCMPALGAVEAVFAYRVLAIELCKVAVAAVRVSFYAPAHLSQDVIRVYALRLGDPVLLGEMVVLRLVADPHVEELAIALSLDLAA